MDKIEQGQLWRVTTDEFCTSGEHNKFKRPVNETARSIAKMFTYETVCGNLILGTITYCITGSWKVMTAITITYIGIKHVIFVINEFVWKRIKIGQVK